MTFPSHEEQEGEDEEPLNFGIKSLEEIRKEKLQQAKRLVGWYRFAVVSFTYS